jgi:hypothetical protein
MTLHIPPRSSFNGISGKLFGVDKNNLLIFDSVMIDLKELEYLAVIADLLSGVGHD